MSETKTFAMPKKHQNITVKTDHSSGTSIMGFLVRKLSHAQLVAVLAAVVLLDVLQVLREDLLAQLSLFLRGVSLVELGDKVFKGLALMFQANKKKTSKIVQGVYA